MKNGDWLFDGCDSIGIAQSDPYGLGGHMHIDIALYDRNGNRLGRVSPAGSGPKGFEPACDAGQWRVIRRPTFPLPRYDDLRTVLNGSNYNSIAVGCLINQTHV